MTSLTHTTNQARLFGLNLGALWRDLLAAWRGMTEWPVISWLWPQWAVHLYLPTGEHALSRNLSSAPLHDEQAARSARFEALLLPENLLLRSIVDVPKLQPDLLQAALAMEVQVLSPFAADDFIWAHEISHHNGDNLRIHVVLSSRKLIARHIATLLPRLETPDIEVWVSRASEPGFIMLPGFGEARRRRQDSIGRWASTILFLIMLSLVAAVVLTPSAKMYLRTQQAVLAMAALQQKAKPAIAQRESFIRTTEQLASLAVLTGKLVSPLPALKLITDALPDDTSLLSLQIQGSKVSITGQTNNAAALMKQLGSTPGLRDVKAPTPATKPLGAPRESFTIEFMLDPVLPKPAS